MIILLHLSVSFQTTWKALKAAPTSNVMRVPHVALLGKLLGDFKKFLQESGILWLPCVLEVNMSSWATSFLAYIDARNLTNLQSVTKILQKIWNYKQPLKTAPRTTEQLMLRVRLWKLMQHWLEGGWGAAKLISIWIRVWQRYFVTGCLKKLEMYCIFFFWDDTLNLLELQHTVEVICSTKLFS